MKKILRHFSNAKRKRGEIIMGNKEMSEALNNINLNKYG